MKLPPSLRYIGGWFLLPNLVLFPLSLSLDLARPLLVLDYAAISLLGPWVGAAKRLHLSAIIICVDLLTWGAQVYGFDLEKLLRSIASLGALNPLFALRTALLITVTAWTMAWLLMACVPARERPRRALGHALLVTLAVFGVKGLEYAAGGNVPQVRIRQVQQPVDLVSSHLWFGARVFLRDETASLATAANRRIHAPGTVALWRAGGSAPASGGAANVVVVVVESLGLFADPRLDNLLFAPFEQAELRRHYDVAYDTIQFRGSTTTAEIRELCRIDADFWELSQKVGHSCLPARLRAAGFRTLALHAYSKRLFGREIWYPTLGFQHMIFAEELTGRNDLRRCGDAFRGVCDADMARVAVSILRDSVPHPTFLYWVTLTTHLPIASADASSARIPCQAHDTLRRSANLCTYARVMSQTLDAVAWLAMEMAGTPTRLVIVGDHGPPFVNPADRGAFVAAVVPSITLSPKSPG